ncbi:hypothetical protein BH10ACT9_BH10ACT9_18100 [soil metagenome]
MRMRAVYPDFYSAREFAPLSLEHRFGLIALWSYVEDNGVGRDDVNLIVGACFPFEMRDPALYEWVATLLNTLAAGRIIPRFAAYDVAYFEFVEWDRWQKPKNPAKVKYLRSEQLPTEAVNISYVDPAEDLRTAFDGISEDLPKSRSVVSS